MSDVAISLKNVSKYYKLYDNPKDRLKEALNPRGKQYHTKYYATKNLSLEVKKGEILGIVGQNGSGKSTLLKLITDVLGPDEGSIEVNGRISALLELGSGFNPEFTGMQNIFFYGTILGFSKEEMQEKLDDILAFADIGEFIEQPLKTYSSGMKSRLGFAVAVHIDPEILILDEVLAVGDVLFRRKCYTKMEEFFKREKTILFVSHDNDSIRHLCTRAIFLESGQILMDGSAKSVSTYYEKYLFAKNENKDKVKQEIQNISTRTEESIPAVEEKSSQRDGLENVKDYFIADFIPKTTVEFKSYEVEIINPHIQNTKGEKVNVLTVGEEYRYCYHIKSGLTVYDFSVSMNIRNEKGVPISGASLHTFKKELPLVEQGEEIEFIWPFKCHLLPDIYYLNTGSSSIINGDRVVLNRIVDAYCFKVISDHPDRYWGNTSLEQYPIIHRKYSETS